MAQKTTCDSCGVSWLPDRLKQVGDYILCPDCRWLLDQLAAVETCDPLESKRPHAWKKWVASLTPDEYQRLLAAARLRKRQYHEKHRDEINKRRRRKWKVNLEAGRAALRDRQRRQAEADPVAHHKKQQEKYRKRKLRQAKLEGWPRKIDGRSEAREDEVKP